MHLHCTGRVTNHPDLVGTRGSLWVSVFSVLKLEQPLGKLEQVRDLNEKKLSFILSVCRDF
jgi:hypothetical protein